MTYIEPKHTLLSRIKRATTTDLVETQDNLHALLRGEVERGELRSYSLNVLGTQDGYVREVEVKMALPFEAANEIAVTITKGAE